MAKAFWHIFKCTNPSCDWECPGTFNWDNENTYKGCLPDTDCPKCGFHDSVTDGDDIEAPKDLDEVRRRVYASDLPYGNWSEDDKTTIAYKAMLERRSKRI